MNPSPSTGLFRRAAFGTIVVAALVLTGLQFLLPPGAVWITDNGNKYILMRNFIAHGSATVVNPAAEIDPGNRFFPDGDFHFKELGGGYRSVYPEFFSVLTIPFYRLFGERGVAVLPILGTLALLSCFLALLHLLRIPPFWAAGLGLGLVFATPFAFYSQLFWEMTMGCALLCGALLALFHRKFLLTGILLGLGLWLREEFYFASAALGAAWLLTAEPKHRIREFSRIVLGAIPPAAALWILQWYQSGHILGLHGALYYTHNTSGNAPTLLEQLFGALPEAYGFYFFSHITQQKWLAMAPILPAVCGAFPRIRSHAALKTGIFFAAALAYFALAREMSQTPAGMVGMAVGLFPALPLAAGFWLNWRPLCCRGARRIRLLGWFVLIYVLLLPPFLTRSDIGVIWSARHFLFVVPFLVALSAIGILRLGVTRKRMLQLGAVLTVAAALLLEFSGIQKLKDVATEGAAVTDVIRATPGRVVLSDVFFLPEQTPQLFFERQWLYIKSGKDIPKLLELLRSHKVDEFTLILSPYWRTIDEASLRLLLEATPPTREIRRLKGEKSGFLEFFIVECRLQ